MTRNEADTRAELIEPALRDAGWGVVPDSLIRREEITIGRLQGSGRRAKQDIADFVLIYRGRKLAVVEAKREGAGVTEGLGQAKRYSGLLKARYAYATNGRGIYRVDMQTGQEGGVDTYATPDELWALCFGEAERRERYWREKFAAVPFEDKSGAWQPRYYQHNAITAMLDAVAKGEDRVLLTLATGTGKTAIAFQIAWAMFHSRWNLVDWRADPPRDGESPASGRRPRILFLADRNILANQAFNAFGAFPDDAMVRIDPDVIRKKGRVPKNGNLFFTIFQTFMTGTDDDGKPNPNFGDYPPDFFDFIVIDECHRGGASDESTWRAILDYFAPAVQLGLTATPKRDKNVDTYAYFGEPVYVYSLKEGINDGYLTPFKVKQIQTTLDTYVYTADDEVIEGEVEAGKRYVEEDFNRIIVITERERKRVEILMNGIDQREKTLVFCATQAHAAAVRDLINQAKTSKDTNYCVRVTANDGAEGERFLRTFQDNEKTIPTILTTSRKLSTGVDARNVRNIVLMRPIKSMIEFKQIIGRGTRLYEGKDYFTVYDFVEAYKHFNDPEWDGEPEEPVIVDPPPGPGPDPGPPPDPPEPPEPEPRPRKIKVKLADGKERQIQHMVATSFWSPDGKPMSAEEFIERLFGDLPELFKDEAELRRLWGKPDTRKALLDGLEEKGYGVEQLAEVGKLIEAENSDLYDVLAYIAYAKPTITRQARADASRPMILGQYDANQRDFLDFVLDHYVAQGVGELSADRLPKLLNLKYHAIADAEAELGGVASIRELFVGFQPTLYADAEVASA